MQTSTAATSIESRILKNIRFHARRLAFHRTAPGMDTDDYEQDLIADLIRRRTAFDPKRSSFVTFADRVVRHRVSNLRTPTYRSRAERNMASLDAPVARTDDESEQTLSELIPDEAWPGEDTIALGIDVHRLLKALDAAESQACEILLADNVSQGAADAGINRSTAYERISRLRERATQQGLAVYLTDRPNTSSPSSVSAQRDCAAARKRDGRHEGASLMPAGLTLLAPRLFVTETGLCDWVAGAPSGETLEYYRGFLIADRVAQGSRLRAEDRAEVVRVAERARTLSGCGLGYLVQRRYGSCDYGYLLVRATRTPAKEGAR